MSSVWIVLLDTSASMADGFSSAAGADPLAERGMWRTKLEAAKDLLLRQVAASRVQDVAVFRFADRALKVFQGARVDLPSAASAIQSLVADGNTNLAEALSAVANDQDLEGYKALSVLILSDGLSNRGNPVAAAEQLITKFPFGRIDTILIDETAEGRRVAESVSINGQVRPAFSMLELGRAVESARASSLRQELAGFARRRLDLQVELASLVNAGNPTLVTVTSPIELTPATLRSDIVPTLEGLDSLGRAASDAAGMRYLGTISSISQDSPISISLTGLKEALELALEWVIPWRREHAKQLAARQLERIEIENRTLEAKQREDVKKAEIENRQREVELAASKMELAERMLKSLYPRNKLSTQRRMRLLQLLVSGIDHLSKTSMEFKVIGPASQDATELTKQ